MQDTLGLTIAIANYPHTEAIKSGALPIAGVDARFADVSPQIAAYRRMVRNLEFDVCELAATTYLIARSHGAPFVALPIFVSRRFHHGGLLVRPDAQIAAPKDLEGKNVGVRAYSVTTGVWTRGILMDEYGLDDTKVTWVVDDEEHVRELALPANVVAAPEGRSLAAMMRDGEIAAGFDGNAGIGREGKPDAGWSTPDGGAADAYRELFPDAATLEAEWHHRTGIYPIHGVIVVKESVLVDHPWVAGALFDAFTRAKADWIARLEAGDALGSADRKMADLRAIVGADPLPYGLAANRASIDALQDYAKRQRLIAARLPLERLFVNPEVQ